MMRRLVILTLFVLTFILPSTSAFAFSPLQQACNSGNTSGSSVCQDHTGANTLYGPNGVIDKIINILSAIIGIVAVFAIVVAGLVYVTSGGESAKINQAKNTILFAAIGIAIVALAQVIESFVLNKIGSSL